MDSHLRTREWGYTYFDRIDKDGPIFYLLSLGAGHDRKVRDSYADSYRPWQAHDSWPDALLYLQRIPLGFLQKIVNALFLRKSDIDFLPNPNLGLPGGSQGRTFDYLKFRIRHFLYALFTLPIAIADTILSIAFSPIKTLKTFWRFLTQSNIEREHEKYRLYFKSIILHKSWANETYESDREKLFARIPLAQRIHLFTEKPEDEERSALDYVISYWNTAKDNSKIKNALEMLKDIPEQEIVYQYANTECLAVALRNNKIELFINRISAENKVKLFTNANWKNPILCTLNNISRYSENLENPENVQLLLQGLSPDQTIETITTLMGKIYHRDQPEVYISHLSNALLDHKNPKVMLSLLLKNMDDISKMSDRVIFKENDLEIKAGSVLSLLFFDKNTTMQNLELRLPCRVKGHDSLINAPIHGFTYALINGTLAPANLTVHDRRAYLLSQSKPLGRAIFERPALSLNLSLWLQDLTPQEKIDALHLVENNKNCLHIALEKGNNALAAQLEEHGMRATWRYDNRTQQVQQIQYDQSIHNPATTKTVCDSLLALRNAMPLSNAQTDGAIKQLRALASTLPASQQNNDVKAVARRALDRLLASDYLNTVETISNVSIKEIFTYFYIGLTQASNDEREELLTNFYWQLQSIQRDNDSNSTDKTICDGGTINQLTLALQKVYPQHVWVVFLDEKSLTLHALTRLPAIITKAYESATNKSAFSKICINQNFAVVPPTLLIEISAVLKQELENEVMYSRNFKPIRCAVHNPQKLLNNVMNILAGPRNGKHVTKEMLKQALPKIDALLAQMIKQKEIQKNTLASQNIVNAQDRQQILARYDLATQSQARPATNLNQYHLSMRNAVMKTDEQEERYRFVSICYKFAGNRPLPNSLPQSFVKMAQENVLMEQLINLLHNKRSGDKIALFDLLVDPQVKTAKQWLYSTDFLRTCPRIGIQNVKPLVNEKEVEGWLFENSVAIYQALFSLALRNEKSLFRKSIDDGVGVGVNEKSALLIN
ncbi:MAG: hypothetical protein WC756_10635 [Taibaiella sp.]